MDGIGFDDSAPLLEVEDLRVEFRTRDGVAYAVNGTSFSVDAGQTLGILGESGCGKSVTAQAVMGILDSPPAYIAGGRIKLRGVDLLSLPEESRRLVRANRVAMVFQDALSSLNPVFTVGYQLGELFRRHRGYSKADARTEAVGLLDLVGI
ncbi:MAG: ABC transporter ATP-binding protein, partial [Geodermatophilaceae bacterium]|nr:ABC transporter ATP-binding protein [Geodermatophilaceae bacterium]